MTIKFCYKFNSIEDSKDISEMTDEEVQEWIANVGIYYERLIQVTDNVCKDMDISLDDNRNVAITPKQEPKKTISDKQYNYLINLGYDEEEIENLSSKEAWQLIQDSKQPSRNKLPLRRR